MSSRILDILLDLPSDLVCSVLSEWVDVKGLSAVDVAYCNHDKRTILLTTISSEQFVLSKSPRIGPANYIIWITKRGIRQNECYVDGNMFDFVQYVKMFGRHMKRVIIVSPHLKVHGVDNMIKAFSYCVWMESLELLDVNVSQEILDAVSNCSLVHELKITFPEPTEEVFSLTVTDAGLLKLSTLIIDGFVACTADILERTSPAALQALQVSLLGWLEAAFLCKYLARGCNLKALCIEGWLLVGDCISLLELCAEAKHIDIDCYAMTETEKVPQLAVLLSRLPLEVLRLRKCAFAGSLLTSLADLGCATVQMLFLDGCYYEHSDINNIGRSCKGLTHIRFKIYSKEQLREIDWTLFCNLTHLMFTVYFYTDKDTNTLLVSLANHCSKLLYLALVSYATPCDFSAIYDKTALPALSVLNVRYRANDDTSMIRLHRPNLQIGRTKAGYPWHTFEDTLHGKEFTVWK